MAGGRLPFQTDRQGILQTVHPEGSRWLTAMESTMNSQIQTERTH